MTSETDGFGPFCGTLGCTDDADVVIDEAIGGRLSMGRCWSGGNENKPSQTTLRLASRKSVGEVVQDIRERVLAAERRT